MYRGHARRDSPTYLTVRAIERISPWSQRAEQMSSGLRNRQRNLKKVAFCYSKIPLQVFASPLRQRVEGFGVCAVDRQASNSASVL